MNFNSLTNSALLLACFMSMINAHAQDNRGRPNILLVISDDIGMDVSTDMYPGLIDSLVEQYGPGGHDHPEYEKIDGKAASLPTLQKLASEGMRFTNVWAQPFCSPTRASILTGLYARENKVSTYEDPLAKPHTSFVRELKDAGYATGLFGKWHLAGIGQYTGMHPKEAGFDVFRGNMGAALRTFWDYEYVVQDGNTAPTELRDEPIPERSLPGIAATTYAPVVKTADAIDWIREREAEDSDQPWFTWLAFNLSHATSSRMPTQIIIPNADTLNSVAMAEVNSCTDEFATADLGDCSGEVSMRAMSNSLDTVLAALIDTVDALDSNTYIIYVGDNGTPMYGRPGLDFIDNMYITRTARGKGTAYEGGALVPMVVRGPEIEANSESREFAHTVDLFSTILQLSGTAVPDVVADSAGTGTLPLDSVSLTPILFDNADSVRDPDTGYVLTESHNLMTGGSLQIGARNGQYKVICYEGVSADSCEFYDIVDDPLEQYPLDTPSECTTTATDDLPASADSHFCRLTAVIRERSII